MRELECNETGQEVEMNEREEMKLKCYLQSAHKYCII